MIWAEGGPWLFSCRVLLRTDNLCVTEKNGQGVQLVDKTEGRQVGDFIHLEVNIFSISEMRCALQLVASYKIIDSLFLLYR